MGSAAFVWRAMRSTVAVAAFLIFTASAVVAFDEVDSSDVTPDAATNAMIEAMERETQAVAQSAALTSRLASVNHAPISDTLLGSTLRSTKGKKKAKAKAKA